MSEDIIAFFEKFDFSVLPIWFQNDIKEFKKSCELNNNIDIWVEQIKADINACEVNNIVSKKLTDDIHDALMSL